MKILTSNTSKRYNIYVGNDILSQIKSLLQQDNLSYNKICIVTDDVVSNLYLDEVKNAFASDDVCTYIVKNGEASKNSENLLKLIDFYCESKLTRSDLIIALGGGVIGDLVGFSASVYLRGIKFVQIPTTLLAQVDSSVGGKTAINVTHGKNLMGSFYMPNMVLCDVKTLSTLNDLIFADGMAEVIKYACIGNADLISTILRLNPSDIDYTLLTEIVSECIAMKINVVEQDEHDLGLRMTLNFGHTFGHAVEKHFGYGNYTHGQGVAIGMVHITKLSEAHGLTEKGTSQKIIDVLCKFNLPCDCPLSNSQLLSLCANDKKNMGKNINLIILNHIGKCFIHKLSYDDFGKFLDLEV